MKGATYTLLEFASWKRNASYFQQKYVKFIAGFGVFSEKSLEGEHLIGWCVVLDFFWQNSFVVFGITMVWLGFQFSTSRIPVFLHSSENNKQFSLPSLLPFTWHSPRRDPIFGCFLAREFQVFFWGGWISTVYPEQWCIYIYYIYIYQSLMEFVMYTV